MATATVNPSSEGADTGSFLTNSTPCPARLTSGTPITRDNAPTRCGGDLWNDAQVARRVLVHPAVESFRITQRTSGLYCYVEAELYDGRSVRLHVTEGRNIAEVTA